VLSEQKIKSRVILPITDPHIVHHGALGSMAYIHLDDNSNENIKKALNILRECNGIYTVVPSSEGCAMFNLAADRCGDIIVIGDQSTTIGRSPEWHDLSGIQNLRSHGGVTETVVPMFVSRPLKAAYSKRLTTGAARNFHLFDFLCNGIDFPQENK